MPEVPDSWRPDRCGLLGIWGQQDHGRAIQFIPFRSVKVLADKAIIGGLKALIADHIHVWIGLPSDWPPSRKIYLNVLTRRDWRRIGDLPC
jgi:hypothetical protein